MTDAHGIARIQLKSIVERVERLEAEISDLNADKSEVYKDARSNGFDVKAIKKVVSRRKLDDHKRVEEDAAFDTYWDAIHGTGLVHAHARENIEEFDPITGEFVEESPRKAAEAEAERPALQVGSETGSAEAGVSGQPEMIPALTVQHDGVNVGGPERAGVTAGETAPNPEMDREEMCVDEVGHSLPAENVRQAEPETEHGSVTHAGAGESPATDQPLTGGDHVDDHRSAATHQAGASFKAPPAKPLRPHCLRPENCGGYGSNHCFSCKKAAKTEEVAA